MFDKIFERISSTALAILIMSTSLTGIIIAQSLIHDHFLWSMVIFLTGQFTALIMLTWPTAHDYGKDDSDATILPVLLAAAIFIIQFPVIIVFIVDAYEIMLRAIIRKILWGDV